MSKKCVCYIRVSTEEQLLGNGVERQRETIKRYLTTLPYVDENDIEERVDEGRSAFKGTHMKKTSKLGRYFSELISGKYDGSVLVMESLDRFSRQNSFEALSNILKLVNEHQIEVHSITPAIVIKQSDPSSLLMATMITSRAHEESVIKSTRKLASAKAKREKAIETGGVITKRTPAWLDVIDGKYVENEFSNIVRRIFNEYSSGIKSSTIAKKLNSEGITYQNRKFTTQSVLWILNNRSVSIPHNRAIHI
ncbi:hypothetical protein E0U70_20040 [Salmonella enterica subsp. enterica serovar Gloucester]|nr:hypothetical protein [Salmonella enterica subsp. enterica serovar Gloucester]